MRPIIRRWFAASDMVAWLLLVFALVGVVLFPFVGPLHARMTQQSVTVFDMAGTCILWLAVAAGAYAIIRRRVLGLLFLLAPVIVLGFSGRPGIALLLAGVWAVVFAAPFLLVLSGSRLGGDDQGMTARSTKGE